MQLRGSVNHRTTPNTCTILADRMVAPKPFTVPVFPWFGGDHVNDRTMSGRGRSARFLRAGGITGMAIGTVLLAVVVQQVHGTGQTFQVAQRDAAVTLQARWEQPVPSAATVPEGEGIVRLYAPRLGPDFAYTVVAGTTQDALARGPGHYTGSALPGQPGNFAVAGHRVTHGAPFGDVDRLESCDALVVETDASWFVYRVLPMPEEAPGWAAGKGAQERCRGVAPLPAPYRDVTGQLVVEPQAVTRIAPVPGMLPGEDLAPAARARLITLTTCHPRYSARERLIVHGVLVAQYPRSAGRPVELAGV